MTSPINIKIVVLAKPDTAVFASTIPNATSAAIVSMIVRLTGIFSIKNEMTARTRITRVTTIGEKIIAESPELFMLRKRHQ